MPRTIAHLGSASGAEFLAARSQGRGGFDLGSAGA